MNPKTITLKHPSCTMQASEDGLVLQTDEGVFTLTPSEVETLTYYMSEMLKYCGYCDEFEGK